MSFLTIRVHRTDTLYRRSIFHNRNLAKLSDTSVRLDVDCLMFNWLPYEGEPQTLFSLFERQRSYAFGAFHGRIAWPRRSARLR